MLSEYFLNLKDELMRLSTLPLYKIRDPTYGNNHRNINRRDNRPWLGKMNTEEKIIGDVLINDREWKVN